MKVKNYSILKTINAIDTIYIIFSVIVVIIVSYDNSIIIDYVCKHFKDAI